MRLALELAPVPVHEDVTTEEGYWVSTAWLESWVNEAEERTPIDNTGLLCCHTANDGSACMDPEKTTSAKRVTAQAWEMLQVGGLISDSDQEPCLLQPQSRPPSDMQADYNVQMHSASLYGK